MNEEQKNAFLLELALLTEKYGIAIGGCGCCDSPYLYTVEGKGSYNDDDQLTWVETK